MARLEVISVHVWDKAAERLVCQCIYMIKLHSSPGTSVNAQCEMAMCIQNMGPAVVPKNAGTYDTYLVLSSKIDHIVSQCIESITDVLS